MLGVFGGQRRDDVGGMGAGHRPQHPLGDDRMADSQHLCSKVWGLGGKHLGGRFGFETADQFGEATCIEQVHRRTRRRELDGMTALGGEV
jgi:hypothetical protein